MNADQIKPALTNYLLRSGVSNSFAGFLDELKVRRGEVWADLVQVPCMHCYEIKSEHDSLRRLIHQGTNYGYVFDWVTLVTAEKHVDKAMPILPTWWGVMVVPDSPAGEFRQLREASENTKHEPEILVTLLHRYECLEILSNLEHSRSWKSKSLYQLHDRIAQLVTVERLRHVVRTALVQRTTAGNDAVTNLNTAV